MNIRGNIKKYIILFTLLFSLSFNQTGIVTPKGENAMGVWGGIIKVIDCDDCKEEIGAEMAFMMENGLELGVSYYTHDDSGSDKENTIFYFQYHFKNIGENFNSPLNFSPNFVIGLSKLTDSETDNLDYDEDVDFTSLNCTLYGDNLFSFRYSFVNQDDSDDEYESILFGKIWDLNSFYFGGSYSLRIEDGKFSDLLEDFDDGIALIKMGVTF